MIRVLVIALSISALLATPLVERKKKVIGGVPAYRGEFPHQVLILRYGYVYCGGSIISTKHVLTAAHCDMATLRNFEVLAGLVSLQDSGSAQRRLLSLYRRHPLFVQVESGFDVAIAKVSQPFAFNYYVKAVSLNSDRSYPFYSLIATGWGETSADDIYSIPDVLQKVELYPVSYWECKSRYGFLPEGVLCAAAPGKDTCHGDSGGPIGVKQSGQFVQYGITSFGWGCADPKYPGVYTEVSKYSDWIQWQMTLL